MTQGFRLAQERHGRGLGDGVYLSEIKEFASTWGSMIIRCQLRNGCRILWRSEYDRKVIKYLKKEFGSDIIKPDFWKQIPQNKQLNKNEIIAVWNYLIEINYGGKRSFEKGLLYDFQQQFSRIHEHLKRHQFDGVGSRANDWPEILIFNPSLVHPVSAHHWEYNKKDFSDSLSLCEIKKIQKIALSKIEEEEEIVKASQRKRAQLLRRGFSQKMVDQMGDVMVDMALDTFDKEIECYENTTQLKEELRAWWERWQ